MKPNGRTSLRWIATTVVTAMVVLQPWFASSYDEIRLISGAWWRHQVNDFMSGWWNVDRMVREAPPDSDLAAIFVNFDSSNSKQVSYVQEVCFRGSYTIYPRRLYIAQEGTAINSGAMIINSRFDPTVLWLQEHQIGNAFYFSPRADGKMVMMRAIVPRSEPNVPAAPQSPGQTQLLPWNPPQQPAPPPAGGGK